MNRFLSPLLVMMSVVIMVAALADRSASAGFNDPASETASTTARSDVTICHPVPSRQGDGLDVVVYEISPAETELIEEHRAHGDLLLNETLNTEPRACPGNVIHGGRP